MPLLSLHGVSKSLAPRPFLPAFRSSLKRGERGLIGPNGSGKTTLRIIADELEPDAGQCTGQGTSTGYLAQRLEPAGGTLRRCLEEPLRSLRNEGGDGRLEREIATARVIRRKRPASTTARAPRHLSTAFPRGARDR